MPPTVVIILHTITMQPSVMSQIRRQEYLGKCESGVDVVKATLVLFHKTPFLLS